MPSEPRRTITDYVCTGCSLMCDDLRLEIEGNEVVSVEPKCEIASHISFGGNEDLSACAFEGLAGDFEEGVARAVDLLASARVVAVAGFERATIEAQRIALEIAELLGGYADPFYHRLIGGSPALPRLQIGVVTETLGEVLNHCDVAVFWACNPLIENPRLLERMRGKPEVLVVETMLASYGHFELNWRPWPGSYSEVLATLKAIVRGIEIDRARVEEITHQSFDHWTDLARRLKAAKHPVFFHDASLNHMDFEQLTELVHDLRRKGSRAVTFSMAPPGNWVGAAQLLTWQTGFPGAVSFVRGYPEQLPFEADVGTLFAEVRIDAALVVGHDLVGHWNASPDSPIHQLKSVVLSESLTHSVNAADVAFGVARFGIETSGTVFRTDGVAMPVRAPIESRFPTTEEVLGRILNGLKQRQTPR